MSCSLKRWTLYVSGNSIIIEASKKKKKSSRKEDIQRATTLRCISLWIPLKVEAKRKARCKPFILKVVLGSGEEGPGRARWELASC